MSTHRSIADDTTQQIDRADDSGRPPVVFIHALWLLPSSRERWAVVFDESRHARRVAAGITAATYADVAAFSTGFQHALWISAAILAAGGTLAFATIRRPLVVVESARMSSCAVDAPPRGPASVHVRAGAESRREAA